MKLKSLLTVFCLFGLQACPHAEEVPVAVAANFAAPMQKIAAAFEQQTGHKVILTSGSTGKFYAQISNGAPFQLLLAADDATPARLEKEGHAPAGTRFTYAIGTLVLWSPTAGLVDKQGDVLRRGEFAHLAIANPKVAPYGVAAVETLRALGVYHSLQERLVMGENIAQTHQFVATGNAALGFVALSQIIKDGQISGSYWIVPAQYHTPIRQDAVLLNKGRDKPAALALLAFLQQKTARDIIQAYGYKH